MAVGMKDKTRDRKDVLEAVFCRKQIETNQIIPFSSSSSSSPSSSSSSTTATTLQLSNYHFNSLYNLVSDCGDLSKSLDSLHHNSLSFPYHDVTFEQAGFIADWFTYGDGIERRSVSEGGDSLYLQMYLPLAAVGVANIIESRSTAAGRAKGVRKHRFEFDNIAYEQRQQQLHHLHLLQSFLCPTNSLVLSGSISLHTCVLDVLSPLLGVLTPQIRPVNFGLLGTNEKKEVEQLMDTLLSLQLTYAVQQTKGIEGNGEAVGMGMGNTNARYELEPPIHRLVQFGVGGSAALTSASLLSSSSDSSLPPPPASSPHLFSSSSSSHRDLPNKVKMLLVHELEFEALRRSEMKNAQKLKELEGKEGEKKKDGQEGEGERTQATPMKGTTKGLNNVANKLAVPPSPADLSSSNSSPSPSPAKILNDEEKLKVLQRLDPSAATIAALAEATTKKAAAAASTATATTTAAAGGKGGEPAKKPVSFLADYSNKLKAKQNARMRGGGGGGVGKVKVEGIGANNSALKVMRSEGKSEGNDKLNGESESNVSQKPLQYIHFKFNEGFTQAVRRTVTVSHFL